LPAYTFAMPVLPGKTDVLREFARQFFVARRGEYEEHCRRFAVAYEQWYLQPSPDGDLWLIAFEAPDIGAFYRAFAGSQAPFDVWATERARSITGLDFSKPPSGPPPNELLGEWRG
jgi:hypothetical protein